MSSYTLNFVLSSLNVCLNWKKNYNSVSCFRFEKHNLYFKTKKSVSTSFETLIFSDMNKKI